MRIGGVLNLLGKLLIILSLMLLTPIPFSFYFHDGMTGTFLLCSLLGLFAGGMLLFTFLPDQDLGYKDGFAIVTFSWIGL
ncbi:MAG: TrkH family potassium uptake protein, partial [Desulfobulbus sp.]